MIFNFDTFIYTNSQKSFMKVDDFMHLPDFAIGPLYVQYKGVFDMQDLYETIVDFFIQKKFKFYEKQQRYRKPGPFGVEILYQFEATRKIEDYYMWIVGVTIETFDMHDVEVVAKDGSRKKMQKGRIWIQITHNCVTDYEKNFQKSAFMAHLRGFYNKYVVRKRAEGVWWDELYYNIVLKLQSVIKERLKMASEGYETRHHSRTH